MRNLLFFGIIINRRWSIVHGETARLLHEKRERAFESLLGARDSIERIQEHLKEMTADKLTGDDS